MLYHLPAPPGRFFPAGTCHTGSRKGAVIISRQQDEENPPASRKNSTEIRICRAIIFMAAPLPRMPCARIESVMPTMKRAEESTRQGLNWTWKPCADIGGISGILSAPRFSIIGGRCGGIEISCGDGCAWVPFPQILKGIFGSSSPMTMHRNKIGRIVCGGVLCAPRTTRIRSGPFAE